MLALMMAQVVVPAAPALTYRSTVSAIRWS
jgi:hypothetical protein